MKPLITRGASLLAGLTLASLTATSIRADETPKITIKMLKDSRLEGWLNGFNVTLNVEGGETQGAAYVRALAKSATDSTGKNLILTSWSGGTFGEPTFEEHGKSKNALPSMNLLNPVRQATYLKELSGEVQLFLPQRDAQSVVAIENLRQQAGRPIEVPVLKENGLEIVLFTKTQSDAYSASKKSEIKEGSSDLGNAFFKSMSRLNDKEIGMFIKDPNLKFVDIEFEDGAGRPLKETSQSRGNQTRTYQFAQPIPDAVRVKIYVATPDSLVEVPFQFNDLKLP